MKKLGDILGVISILTVIISIICFYLQRGPNADIDLIINSLGILSICGILMSISSWFILKRYMFLIVGILANGFVLVVACFLAIAMGISEP